MTLKDIDKLLKKLKLDFDSVYDKYRDDIKITKRDILRAQDYIVLLIHRGIPLRNNLANLKIVQKTNIPSDSKENYIVRENKKFYFLFQNYKTDKTFGKKKIVLDSKIAKYIKDFIRIKNSIDYNESSKQYLIVNSKLEPISPNGISKLLLRIFKKEFDKNVSTSMIRHIYLSDKYSTELKERVNDSDNMMHSLNQQKDYIKL